MNMNFNQIAMLQKLKGCLDRFRTGHPKFPLFLKAVSQEALVEGSVIEITVTAPDGNHTVYIRDNGIGIGEPKEPEGHYGLNIMRERAERLGGTLTFSHPSGVGTLVSISFRSAEGEESQLM